MYDASSLHPFPSVQQSIHCKTEYPICGETDDTHCPYPWRKTGKWNSEAAGIQRYSASAWTSLPLITSLDDIAETGPEGEAIVMLSNIKVACLLD